MGHLGGATVTTAAGPPLPRAAAMVCPMGILPVHRQPGGEEFMVFWGCCRRLPGPLSLSHEPSQAREEWKPCRAGAGPGAAQGPGQASTSPAVGWGWFSILGARPRMLHPGHLEALGQPQCLAGGRGKAAVAMAVAGFHFVPIPPCDPAPQEACTSGPNSPCDS